MNEVLEPLRLPDRVARQNQEEKKNAVQPQGRKAMSDLFKARTKPGCHQFEIVTGFVRRSQKMLVGQRKRAGEIVAQTDLADITGFLRAEVCTLDNSIDLSVQFQGGHLERHLKSSRRRW